VFKPHEPVARNFKPFANLKAQLFDAIRDAFSWIASRLDTCDYNPTVWQVNLFDETYAIGSVSSLVREEFRFICDLPQRKALGSNCEFHGFREGFSDYVVIR
jgi:hypothetical protein